MVLGTTYNDIPVVIPGNESLAGCCRTISWGISAALVKSEQSITSKETKINQYIHIALGENWLASNCRTPGMVFQQT